MKLKINKYLKNLLLRIANYNFRKGYFKKAEYIFYLLYIFRLYDEKILLNFGETLFRNERIYKSKKIFKINIIKRPKLSILAETQPFIFL